MSKRKLANILEMANGKVKGSEIWHSGVGLGMYGGTFDLAAFKSFWSHSVY